MTDPEAESAAVDLSILDPRRDPEAFERLVRRATDAAMRAQAHALRRAEAPGSSVLDGVALWARAELAAAALIAALTVPLLLSHRPASMRATPRAPTSLAEASGIPRPLVEWARGQRIPDPGELVSALGTAGNPTSRSSQPPLPAAGRHP